MISNATSPVILVVHVDPVDITPSKYGTILKLAFGNGTQSSPLKYSAKNIIFNVSPAFMLKGWWTMEILTRFLSIKLKLKLNKEITLFDLLIVMVI